MTVKISYLFLMVLALFAGCEKFAENVKLEKDIHQTLSKQYTKDNDSNASLIFDGETYSIYSGESMGEYSNPDNSYEFSRSSEQLSIFANIENGNIIGYTLTIKDRTKSISADITTDDFERLRDAMSKFLEWDTAAHENDVENFDKQIPITLESEAVTWSEGIPDKKIIKRGCILEIEFWFIWHPSNADFAKGTLQIRTNEISSYLGDTYSFQSNSFYTENAKMFLKKTTPEQIVKAIEFEQDKQIQADEQRKKQDDMFK
jgi:hypothetical protein